MTFVVVLAALELILAPFEPTVGWVDTPIHNLIGGVLLGILLRGYISTVVASELTDQQMTRRETVAFVTRRLLPLSATLLGMIIIAAIAFALSLMVVSLLVFDTGVLGPSVFEGVTPTLLFGSVVAVIFYKFWLAPDIAVVGGVGPVTALRMSWTTTTTQWLRVASLLVSFVATVAMPDIFGGALAATNVEFMLGAPGSETLVSGFRWLTTSVWYCVGAQIYVRSILSGPVTS
ncbi:hypothetical protein C463_11930 [Halorubrum californiense DSM 19288]|uniref:Uncharacterized protein n=1 Tax=Halorubrum californiense DSM 19288 TaxID=1227465 RepID=M0E2F7_9EURY|nr:MULTISPECIES: hypothetical protein [Halorubrum]ELZ41975.1 hypothetical protein C463_11930 [Halorubrum californiense DSM 19288]TKX66581.1 hypothetical protein EXE40_15755 [Halorubrum sp. GN11GM_10-3_MGM]